MVMTDPIADLLTRIRNANQMKHETVDIPASKLKKEILEVLKKEGYIVKYALVKGDVQDTLRVTLKYLQNDRVIKGLKRISKPGRRVYSRATSIPKIQNGLGLAILSTPKGVMSDNEARKNNIGGEIICRVF